MKSFRIALLSTLILPSLAFAQAMTAPAAATPEPAAVAPPVADAMTAPAASEPAAAPAPKKAVHHDEENGAPHDEKTRDAPCGGPPTRTTRRRMKPPPRRLRPRRRRRARPSTAPTAKPCRRPASRRCLPRLPVSRALNASEGPEVRGQRSGKAGAVPGAKLSGFEGMEACQGTCAGGLPTYENIPQRRDVRLDVSDASLRGIDSLQHCGGKCAFDERLSPIHRHGPRFAGGTRDAAGNCLRPWFSSTNGA